MFIQFSSPPVPMLSVSVSSSTDTVLDISGYNSFTLQCGGTFSPYYSQGGVHIIWTRNGEPVTDGLSIGPLMTTGTKVSQNSSVEQTASSGPNTLVYNCTVVFSISGTVITTNSNTTQITVKGKLEMSTHHRKSTNQTLIIILFLMYKQVPHYQQLQ